MRRCGLLNEFCFRWSAYDDDFSFDLLGMLKFGEAALCSLNWSEYTKFSACYTRLIELDCSIVVFNEVIES